MNELMIGVDRAKRVFQIHGATVSGEGSQQPTPRHNRLHLGQKLRKLPVRIPELPATCSDTFGH